MAQKRTKRCVGCHSCITPCGREWRPPNLVERLAIRALCSINSIIERVRRR